MHQINTRYWIFGVEQFTRTFYYLNNKKMTLRNLKGALAERIVQIDFSNEMLQHGISELEALCLRIESGTVQNITEAHVHASILNVKNQQLAKAINTALKELESKLKRYKDPIKEEIVKEVVHEFLTVLRSSIRAFHEYKMIQDEYFKLLQKINTPTSLIIDRSLPKARRPLPIIQRIMQTLCICGC